MKQSDNKATLVRNPENDEIGKAWQQCFARAMEGRWKLKRILLDPDDN